MDGGEGLDEKVCVQGRHGLAFFVKIFEMFSQFKGKRLGEIVVGIG